MNGKILGVPLVLVLLVLSIVALVDLPLVGFNAVTQRKLNSLQSQVQRLQQPSPKIVPTAAPTPTPTPVAKGIVKEATSAGVRAR